MSANDLRLLDPLFTTEAMAAVFADRATVQGILDFEAALARAEGALSIIPVTAVEPIIAATRAANYDLSELAIATATAGNPALPLIYALTRKVAAIAPAAAQWVHWGATSQDAIDTGRMLQCRQALDGLESDLTCLKRALARLANAHRLTLMPGRTFLQQATPISFGLKVAGWLDAVCRSESRLQRLHSQALALQLGGAVGNYAVLGARGIEVAALMADALQLSLPTLPWHTQRDRIIEIGAGFALLIGALGKIARDIALLMQSEIAEATEPMAPGRGGSSTLPHKHNPVSCTVALAAAYRAPGLMASLYGGLAQEHERALGGWHAEWEVLPELCRLAAGALAHMASAIEGLEVDTGRMLTQVTDSAGILFAEAISIALAGKIGKQAAQTLISQLADDAIRMDKPLREIVEAEPRIQPHLTTDEIARLFSAELSLGASDELIDRVLANASN